MTSAADSEDTRPVVALLCSRGMEAFLSNALAGMLRVGVDPARIVVGCPGDSLDVVRRTAWRQFGEIEVVSDDALFRSGVAAEGYREYGSPAFVDICWAKIALIRRLLDRHPHVVYTDVDVAWIGNPLPYLIEVAQRFPIAFQTEGLGRFPPALCCGFASFRRSVRSIALLDTLIAQDAAQDRSRLDDQALCQRLVESDPAWLRDIFWLPEHLFLNGLGYRQLLAAPDRPPAMTGELSPLVFHANWTLGIENKRSLMQQTGTWLVGDDPGGAALATSDEPILSVIYPVFDVRGDAAQRIRLWTQGQDLAPHRYRVLVVAGDDADFDEAAIRKVLRPRDAVLRLPGAAQDADCWNAGARASASRWLLFVEAHGLPRPGTLSALAAWIDTNPDGEVCNLAIENRDTHWVARLMKRWFAEMHAQWSEATWRRLHRTAFAIRADVFEAAGAMQAQYAQFSPQLLSARLHQCGFSVAMLRAPAIVHEDDTDIMLHHADTADFVRGEMQARADSDPAFFERYFGSSPASEHGFMSAQRARSLFKVLVAAAFRRPGRAGSLVKPMVRLLPLMCFGLRQRAALLAALTRLDELAMTHLPLPQGLLWRRFLLAHGRVARAERMLWLVRHPPPLPSLRAESGDCRWPIDEIDLRATIGLHALEQFDGRPFRWSRPWFLVRIALPPGRSRITLETGRPRNLPASDIVAAAGRHVIAPADIAVDDAGNIHLDAASSSDAEVDVVVAVPALGTAAATDARALGLPLFAVRLARAPDPPPS